MFTAYLLKAHQFDGLFAFLWSEEKMAWLSNQHAPTKSNQLCILAIKIDDDSIDYLPAIWDLWDSEDKHFTLTVDRPDIGDVLKLNQVDAYMIYHPLTIEDTKLF
ncbi:hypothetical protein [Acinetobacter pittii]|uniref:hypothetical protein n=1 Tax=Acinetobacter pittii TaxID=48296 RepID=UPI001D174331|nr:hypothetical protein [Acinetobacter pittii]